MTLLGAGSRATHAVARAVTNALSPFYLVVGLLLLVGAASHTEPLRGVGWGLLAATFAGLIPYAFVLRGVQQGRYSDRHVRLREQRTTPLLFGGVCVTAGLGLLAALGAPRQILALVVALLTGLAVTLGITLWWKISVHTAVASGTAVILALVFGPVLLAVTAPLVAGVAWSRVALRDHTPAQVLGGAAMGSAVAAAVFSALR